jgi:hypothetical protein
MKVVISSRDTMTNQALRVHSIGQQMKVILPSYNSLPNEAFRVHSIGQ